ncbi:acidic leucine-rich nuclear phosphoprotein 32 family member A [Culicoides brevitarsis]|uniref:acidic leucine-rich nuclear phosphoprotein 32 family member A n=1 Tax=Culicoides brevitarsis TaxID=469753 RepID=UPI00307BD32D
MEKRIALEKRGRTEDQITELNLDNCRSTSIEGLTDAFTNLESLSLINVGLVSLKNFPKLKSLKRLELSDNRISNGLDNITSCESIKSLNLSGNRIKEISELLPLAELKELEVLDLFNNEVTNVANYREKIFDAITSLKYLDGYDKNNEEAPSDAEDDDANHVEDEESENENEESEDDEVGLSAVYNEELEDDSDEYNGEEGDDDEDDEEEEGVDDDTDEDENETRGTKRKAADE